MKEPAMDESIQSISEVNDLENSKNLINTNAEKDLKNIDNLLNDIKPTLNKIRCPYCPLNCVCKIDPSNYTISSDCSNNHNYNSDLIEFYDKSNSQQDENIKCSINNCRGNEEEKKELYYCSCGVILCKKCKVIHENKNKNKNDENEDHNFINLKDKDIKCCCDNHFAKFVCYCQKCQKNLCPNCLNSHREKNHIISFFNEEKIKKKVKEKIKKELEKQKADLSKFIGKAKNIIKELNNKINELQKHLLYFVKINEIIFKSDDNKKLNHETITNIKNIKTSFDEKFYDFINNKNFNESIVILMNLFEYQKDKERKTVFKTNDAPIQDEKNKDFKFTFDQVENHIILEEKINVMCEIKSKNLFAFGGESGKIYLYEKNFKKAEFDITNEKQPIKYLCELRDGFLVVCTSDYFKTYEIVLKDNLKEFHIIQKIEYQEENHNGSKSKVVELSNRKLLSTDGNLVKIWRKKLNNNLYEKEHEIEIDDLIFDLFEMNINMFAIYTINNNIRVFDSENYEDKCNKSLNEDENNNNWRIVSAQKLNNDIIIIVEKNMIILYSIIGEKTIYCECSKNIDGIYRLSENQFYVYNTISENSQYGVMKYEYSISKSVYKAVNTKEIRYNHQIGFMYKISTNEENKNLLLIKFNNYGKDKSKNDAVLILKEGN